MSLDKNLERIAREEGIKNPADIYDQTTLEEIKREIESVSPNIKELLDETKLSYEQKECLSRIREFCNELTDEFRSKFLSLFEEHKRKRRQISPNFVNHLLEKKFDFPQFTIAQGVATKETLINYGLDASIDDQNLLLAFQLPKPLAYFWWKKRIKSGGDLPNNSEEGVIEWGHLYEELVQLVWYEQGLYENEKGLDFYRLNGIGVHDSKKFYYVWEMSSWDK